MHCPDQPDEQRCFWCRKIIDETESLDLLLKGAGKLCAGCLEKIRSQSRPCSLSVSIPDHSGFNTYGLKRKKQIYIHLQQDEEGSLNSLLRRGFVFEDTDILEEIPMNRLGKRLLKKAEVRILARKQVSKQAMEIFLKQKNILKQKDGSRKDMFGSKNNDKSENHIFIRNEKKFNKHFPPGGNAPGRYVWFSVFDLDDRQKIRLLQDPECSGIWILYGRKPNRKVLMKQIQAGTKERKRVDFASK